MTLCYLVTPILLALTFWCFANTDYHNEILQQVAAAGKYLHLLHKMVC